MTVLLRERLPGAAYGVAVVWAGAAEVRECGALGGVPVCALGVAVCQAGGLARHVAGEGLWCLRERQVGRECVCAHWLRFAYSGAHAAGLPSHSCHLATQLAHPHLRRAVRGWSPGCGAVDAGCCQERHQGESQRSGAGHGWAAGAADSCREGTPSNVTGGRQELAAPSGCFNTDTPLKKEV